MGAAVRHAKCGPYKTAIGARAALKRMGVTSLAQLMDQQFPRIGYARALPGDIVELGAADDPKGIGALAVYLGNQVILGYHQDVEGVTGNGDARGDHRLEDCPMKIIRTAALVVGAVALVATGVGAVVGGAAFLTATGVSLATVSAIGTAAGIATTLTAKKPRTSLMGSLTDFRLDPQAGLPYVMGRTLFGGYVAHRETWGQDNQYQGFTIAWSAGGPIDAIEYFTADRTQINFDGAGAATGSYAGWMWLKTQLGDCPSPALATPVAGFPGYGGAFKLSGFAAGTWVLKFDTKGKKYSGGVPKPAAMLRGVKVYDPRLDSTYPGGVGPCRALDESTYVYSENPWLHEITFALGRWQNAGKRVLGVGMPVAGIDLPAMVEAANVADANAWKIGGVITTLDDKWNTLKLIAQAGGGEPMRLGAKLSCLVNMPRVSLATITEDALIGKGQVIGTKSRRGRINGIVPRFPSPDHGWETISADLVQVPGYVALDNGQARTREVEFPLVPYLAQASQLAAYQIVNAREIGAITLPLKLEWVGYKPGDCLTVHLPKLGLFNQPCIVKGRTLDPATGTVTLVLESETAGKHAFALGQAGAAPPIPTLTAPAQDVVAAPGVAQWAVAGGTLSSVNGSVPALLVTGAVENTRANEVVFEYRLTAGPGPWVAASTEAPDTTAKYITAVAPTTSYEVAVSYRVNGVLGARRVLGPVTTGVASSGSITGSVDIATQFVDSGSGTPSAILPRSATLTALGVAAAIAGQGALATKTTADWSTDVTGVAKPFNYAGKVLDTRADNEPPSFYYALGQGAIRDEFKDSNFAGSGSSGYGALRTVVQYPDASGGPVKQTILDSAGQIFERQSVSAAAWGAWGRNYNAAYKPIFGSDLREDSGTLATLAAFKTGLGTAAAIAGQGTGATANNLAGLNAAEGSKLSGVEAGATFNSSDRAVNRNSNFEAWAGALPVGWVTGAYGFNGPVTREGSVGAASANSTRGSSVALLGGKGSLTTNPNDFVAVTPGETIWLSWRVKSGSVAATFYFGAEGMNGAGAPITPHYADGAGGLGASPSSANTVFSGTASFAVPAGVYRLRALAINDAATGAGSDAIVDYIEIHRDQPGADVTGIIVGNPVTSLSASSTGVLDVGEIDKTVQFALNVAGANITSGVTWSVTLISGAGTYAITTNGLLSWSGALADENELKITATAPGQVPRVLTHKVEKKKAAPTINGSAGGGTPATVAVSLSSNTTSMALATPSEAIVTVGSAGVASFQLTLSADSSVNAVFTVEEFAIVQWWNGSAWVDQGTETASNPDLQRAYDGDGGEYFYYYTVTTGDITITGSKTGLTAGSSQKFRAMVAIGGGECPRYQLHGQPVGPGVRS